MLSAVAAFLIVGVGGVSPVQAGTLSAGGVTLSWDDGTMYAPKNDAFDFKDYKFTYANNSATDASIQIEMTDKFSDKVGVGDIDLAKPGQTGILEINLVTSKELTNGLGPYTLTLTVKPFTGSDSQATFPISFLSRDSGPAAKTVRCINKKTLSIKTYKATKCPSGWKLV